MFSTAFLDLPPLAGAAGTVTLPGSKSLTNRALDPEEFTHYEIGAKWDLRPDLALTAAMYHLDRTNVVIADPADATKSLLVDGQRAKGEAAVADHVPVVAGGSFPKGIPGVLREPGVEAEIDDRVADGVAPGLGPVGVKPIVADRAGVGHFRRVEEMGGMPVRECCDRVQLRPRAFGILAVTGDLPRDAEGQRALSELSDYLADSDKEAQARIHMYPEDGLSH